MVLHDSPLILEPLYSSPSTIIGHCLSCQDKSKVGRDSQCAWMEPYHHSLKVLERQFNLGTDTYLWKDICTEVRSSIIFLMAGRNYILLVQQDGNYVFNMVHTIQVTYRKRKKYGKKRKRDKTPINGAPFKEQSIYYKYLPYWADLEVCHAINGMHLKKNVFGNTIELLLETSAKTKRMP